MRPFRLKDKKTGLYYCPSRLIKVDFNGKSQYVKSNLSKKGKIYFKPYWDNQRLCYDHTELQASGQSVKPTIRNIQFTVEYFDV